MLEVTNGAGHTDRFHAAKQAPAEVAYVYVISRRDLPQPHLTIQINHAVIAATRAYDSRDDEHPHLVVCAVEDETALTDAFNRLKDAGVPCAGYYEDSMNDSLTAIATAPLRGDQRRHLRGFKLL